MIQIIDYGIGNLRSIEKAVEFIGADVVRSDRIEDIQRADRIILPGVGAFGACVDELRRRNLEQPILEAVASGKPFLGVCVGLQMLFEESEEMGIHKGLGLMKGRVAKFQSVVPGSKKQGTRNKKQETLKIPHMGWNQILAAYPGHPLLTGIADGTHFYFVHSFHAMAADVNDVLATCSYGTDFPAIVARGNVMGVQFHPEKSQDPGLRILKNFAKLKPNQLV